MKRMLTGTHMSGRRTKVSKGITDAAEILMIEMADEPDFSQLVAKERERSTVARAIYDARSAAGLSQAQLARIVGTTQSVIARLESADYEGHTFNMLRRIADALSQDVDVRLVSRTTVRA